MCQCELGLIITIVTSADVSRSQSKTCQHQFSSTVSVMFIRTGLFGDGQRFARVTVYLQSLLLWCQCVDDSDPPGFGWQSSHLVALVLPPRLAEVSGPVTAGSSRGDMHKAAPGGVVPHTLGLGIHIFEDLRRDDMVRWEQFWKLLAD